MRKSTSLSIILMRFQAKRKYKQNTAALKIMLMQYTKRENKEILHFLKRQMISFPMQIIIQQ